MFPRGKRDLYKLLVKLFFHTLFKRIVQILLSLPASGLRSDRDEAVGRSFGKGCVLSVIFHKYQFPKGKHGEIVLVYFRR